MLPEDSTAGQTLTQTLRSWCDVPVALLPPTADAAFVSELAAAWAAEGRQLWVVGDVVDQLDDYVAAPVGRRARPGRRATATSRTR